MYKGELEGFPKEVVDLMLERQYEQKGKRDVTIFEAYKNAWAGKGGFDWSETEEGYEFWKEVIWNRNFDVFFDRYPKKESEPVQEQPTTCAESVKINSPDYYTIGGVEPIDLIEAKELNFNLGNVIKYVARSGKKSPDQLPDLIKALDYLQRGISRLEKK
jgi:hypothetical protein